MWLKPLLSLEKICGPGRRQTDIKCELRSRHGYTITQVFSLANLTAKQLLSKEVGGRRTYFIHSLIHQIFIGLLLCARHYGHVRTVVVAISKYSPALMMEVLFLLEGWKNNPQREIKILSQIIIIIVRKELSYVRKDGDRKYALSKVIFERDSNKIRK